jgi:rsbT co-antagonist protein RsbR
MRGAHVNESELLREIEGLKAQLIDMQRGQLERDAECAALRSENALLRQTFDVMSTAVVVVDVDGHYIIYNKAARKMRQGDPKRGLGDENQQKTKAFLADQKTPMTLEHLPATRALRGETVEGFEFWAVQPSMPDGRWYSVNAQPVRETHDGSVQAAVVVFEDVSLRKRLDREITARDESLAATVRERSELIGRLRLAIDELSTPILRVGRGVLLMPIIGVMDSKRSADMMNRVLAEVSTAGARSVIIDLTGVDLIDTATADHFMKLVRAIELLGARCVLSGIRPAVAQALVDLGVTLGSLITLRDLEQGLRYCSSVLTEAPRAPAARQRTRTIS